MATLDLNLFEYLYLAMMMDRKMNIHTKSSDAMRFIVNHHSASAMFCWSLARTAKLRNVLQLDKECHNLYSFIK